MELFTKYILVLIKVTTVSGALYCETGWDIYDGHCYRKFSSPELGFTDARFHCQSFGADLVVITTSAENSHVLDMYVPNLFASLWIGVHNVQGTFVYTDEYDTPVTYTYWNSGEPDYSGTCVRIYLNKWRDSGCGSQPYLCEREQWDDSTTVIPSTSLTTATTTQLQSDTTTITTSATETTTSATTVTTHLENDTITITTSATTTPSATTITTQLENDPTTITTSAATTPSATTITTQLENDTTAVTTSVTSTTISVTTVTTQLKNDTTAITTSAITATSLTPIMTSTPTLTPTSPVNITSIVSRIIHLRPTEWKPKTKLGRTNPAIIPEEAKYAQLIGITGIFVILGVLVAVIVMDIDALKVNVRLLRRNIRNLKRAIKPRRDDNPRRPSCARMVDDLQLQDVQDGH